MSRPSYRERVEEHRGYKYIRLKTGRLITYWEARTAADRALTDLQRAVSRAYRLSEGQGSTEDYNLESLGYFLDQIHEWVGAVEHGIEKRNSTKSQRERITLLRNVTGRTPAEAEAFGRKADELERRLDQST